MPVKPPPKAVSRKALRLVSPHDWAGWRGKPRLSSVPPVNTVDPAFLDCYSFFTPASEKSELALEKVVSVCTDEPQDFDSSLRADTVVCFHVPRGPSSLVPL